MSYNEGIIDLNSVETIEAPATEQRHTGDLKFITKIPGPENPLIVKLLPNPNKPSEGYIPMNYYQFKVGPNQQDVRLRPSLKSLGISEEDPENTRKWEIISALSKLKKEGVDKNHSTFKNLMKMKEPFEPKSQGWVYVIEPGKAGIKCLKLNTMMINILFGREGSDKIKAIPSLIENLSKKGRSPYKISQENCWLKIYKTGEGLATEYFIKPCTFQEVNADGDEVTKWETYPVAEELKKGVKLSDFPDVVAFESKNAFTVEETIAFVESDGVIFPSRFAPKARNQNRDEQSHVETASVVTPVNVIESDDIPF